MNNIPAITFIGVIVLCILIYLHTKKFLESFTPTESKLNLEDILVSNNLEQYEKYKSERDSVLGNSDFAFGYSELPNTNPNTIGFCPFGNYFKGKWSGNTKDVNSKCKPCLDCTQEKGYYPSGGCVGNKNATCTFGRVPYGIFKQAHRRNSLLHQHLPIDHTHPITNSDGKTIPSNKRHIHI